MNTLFQEYKDYLDKNTTKNTAMAYKSDLTSFLKETRTETVADISNLTPEKINEYISNLKNKGMAYTSLARILASLNKFFAFCSENGIIHDDLTKAVTIPQRQRKLPDTISFDEVVKILEAPDEKTVKGIRDKAMLELMYATGARVSEIITLKVNDISIKNEVVMFNSGSDKHRFVPIGKTAVNAMIKYLKNSRPKIPCSDKNDAMFLNFYGKQLTRQGFWKIIKHYIESVGITDNVTAKTLRHSFALHLLSNGADAQAVTEMMGYSDVSSTKIYYDVMNNKIRDVYKKAHPRA